VIVVVRRIVGVEIVNESKRTKIKGQSEEGRIICIQDAIRKRIRLPVGNGYRIATDDFAVKTGKPVLFGLGRPLNG
jgi:hypothetical protein